MIQNAKTLAKTALGSLIDRFSPWSASAGNAGQDKLPPRLRNLVLQARLERARKRGDNEAIRQAQSAIWQVQTADSFYARYRDRLAQMFFGQHQVLIDQLVQLDQQSRFSSLIEVGCGEGMVLAHCADRLPGLKRLTGVDINPASIALCRQTWANNDRLKFECSDASVWLSSHAADDMILLSYGGVMEYFNESDLSKIYADLARHKRVAVALVEPVALGHNLKRQTGSFVFGQENSFSHNYPHLLREAGFGIYFMQELMMDDVRWMLVIATINMEKPNV
jgi:SAM-dependent methyltransferase